MKRITKEKNAENELDRSNTPPLGSVSATSISDVFADHLMQKAKETLGEPIVMKTKSELNFGKPSHDDGRNNDFDIPTISEIAKDAVEKVVCRKELTELEELQKKINQAKRQLRQITDESEDDDFINLRADKHDLDTANEEEAFGETIHLTTDKNYVASKSHAQTPTSKNTKETITFTSSRETNRITETEFKDGERRRSIHDRLGNRPRKENVISLSANRRVEQQLYVPSHRRNEIEKETRVELDRRNKTSNEHNTLLKTDADDDLNRKCYREKICDVTDLRHRVQTKRSTSDKTAHPTILNRVQKIGHSSINKRIGSRIIVAPPRSKIILERKKDTIVSSVVNIQPRPTVPKSKQACKSLLLRAVAEAQKSTALVKPAREPKLGINRSSREQIVKVHSMDNNKSSKPNIVVEVETSPFGMETVDLDETGTKEDYILSSAFVDEEYDPEYEPHLLNRDLNSKYVACNLHVQLIN